MNNKYEVKKIYYNLLGIKEVIVNNKDIYINTKTVIQFNKYMDSLSVLLGEDFYKYRIDESENYGDNTYNPLLCLYQINPVIIYLENMHINSSEYQINKVGYLYNSIEDKELKDRCGDILLGDGAFDRAINQATQILEDRIKKKSGLKKSSLFGLQLISKAVHPKIDKTILKFSDEPEVQEGYSFLFKGLISIYRNPTHHSFDFECSREYALKFCAYIDELLREIDKSIVLNNKNELE